MRADDRDQKYISRSSSVPILKTKILFRDIVYTLLCSVSLVQQFFVSRKKETLSEDRDNGRSRFVINVSHWNLHRNYGGRSSINGPDGNVRF